MKKIVSGSDAIINLELKDCKGYIIPLYDDNVVDSLEITVYTKTTEEENFYVITDKSKLQDNHIKIQSEDLSKLNAGQIYIKLDITFYCDEFEDGKFNYKNNIPTNIILK